MHFSSQQFDWIRDIREFANFVSALESVVATLSASDPSPYHHRGARSDKLFRSLDPLDPHIPRIEVDDNASNIAFVDDWSVQT